jgi:hypothetical protein
MRTKTLILAAALSAAAISSSTAQVFSRNSVGYYRLDLRVGFNLIANQFNNGANDVSTVFPVVPDGTSLLVWNSASAASGGQRFLDAELFIGGLGWINSGSGEPSTAVIAPGGGCFINTPSATTITVLGEVPEGTLTVGIPALFSIVSQPTPQALAIDDAGDELPAVDGDSLLFFNSDATPQGYFGAILFIGGLGWLDSESGNPVSPTPAVGQAFFYNHFGTANLSWTRTFEVD